MRRLAGLETNVGDRIELRVVDAALANAFFAGIPAARLMARARLAFDMDPRGSSWDERIAALLGSAPVEADRVRQAVGRHTRVAQNEGPLVADDPTIAALVLAVAGDGGQPGRDASLAEIAPRMLDGGRCSAGVVRACARHDDRLGVTGADARAPAFEACIRLATRALVGPVPWERLRAIAAQLERAEIGVSLFASARSSIFPPGLADAVAAGEQRMTGIDRAPLDALVAIDPRRLAHAVWRTEQAAGGANLQLATFLADLTRLLARAGALVAAASPRELADRESSGSLPESPESWLPTEWTPSTASAMAEALERGATTFSRVRAAVARGGEPALDAMGAEILRADGHAFANAAFAELLARSARPRDVLRLVTYFAIAPDPGAAARALGSCGASELPRVLKAWLEAMLPQDADDGDDTPEATARVSACIASLKPYPHLYREVERLLPRVSPSP
jgi:hypothetical protein